MNGAIMGTSPGRSVVNPWLQHRRLPNLWVVPGSAFPQNGWGNPRLTILALTLRAADGMIERYLKQRAACDRIFPSDATKPGSREAGVVVYIDPQLAGPYGRDKYCYTKRPFVDSVPEQGYQGERNPREIYRESIGGLGNFADLSAAERDERLRAIERTPFFRLLREHTIEDMFSDPLDGGSANMIGWQLIGYPGPVMNYRDEIDKSHEAWRRKPVSLAQIVGHRVAGWEQEKE